MFAPRLTVLFLLLAAAPLAAQDVFPDAVSRLINDDTVAVVRVDVKSLDLAVVGPVLRDGFDVAHSASKLAESLEKSLQKLKDLQVGEVFLVQGTADIPFEGLLIVPAADTKPVADALATLSPNNVEAVAGAVIFGSPAARRRAQATKPANRREFAEAMNSFRGMTIQIIVAPGNDARRVLRELPPVVPAELGGSAGAEAVSGLSWAGAGITLSPKPEFRLIADAINPSAARAVQQTMTTSLLTFTQLEVVKRAVPTSVELRRLVIPRLDGNRVILTLDDSNSAVKRLFDEAVTPLLAVAKTNLRTKQSLNNLKQMGLAMYNYESAFKSFPPAASVSKDGAKKLLSWRVHLLPYLDASGLYKEFRLDEPWDSEHNKALISKMPDVFASSNISVEQRQQGMTTYLAPVGEKTVFANQAGTKIQQITDGTSQTILIVEAQSDRATIWTKPDDLPFDPKDPWRGLAVPPKGQFWAAFCDGSVRRMTDVSTVNLRRYLQMNDGEVIDP